MARLIGIDIGGTWTRVAAVADGRVANTRRVPSSAIISFSGPPLVSCLADFVAQCCGKGNHPSAIGLAVPATIDRRTGLIRKSVNLPMLEGLEIAKDLGHAAGCPVTLITDADAAAWGEYSAVPCSPAPFVHLRLGTGVACGIIRLGESIPLDEPRTTHAPTLVVDQQGGRACRCGLRGCLETIASGPALKRAAADLGIESGLAGLQREAEHGHPQAGDLLRSAAAAMLIAVEKLESQFGPFVLSLGGGVIDALPQLFHTFIQSSRRARHAPRDIQSGRLADTAGAIGAARMAARALL